MSWERRAAGTKAPASSHVANASRTSGTRARFPEKTKKAAKVTMSPQSMRKGKRASPAKVRATTHARQTQLGSTPTTAATQHASAPVESAA